MQFKQSFIPRSILTILILAVTLNIARILIFHSTAHVYILWNIFLAFLPLVVSSVLLFYSIKQKLSKALFFVGGFIWLMLIPNSPYIVTDLIHIGQGRTVPAIFDSFVLFSSALAGMLMFVYSLSQIEKITLTRYSQKATSVMVAVVILLISFGIYIGRFLRWNSWDVFLNPFSLYEDVRELIVYPTKSTDVLIYVGLFFVFIYMSYRAWKNRANL